MSIILNALKKLEKDPADSETGGFPSMREQTRSHWFAQRNRSRIKILSIVTIFLLVSVSTVGYLWIKKPSWVAPFFSEERPSLTKPAKVAPTIVRKIPPAAQGSSKPAGTEKSISGIRAKLQTQPAAGTPVPRTIDKDLDTMPVATPKPTPAPQPTGGSNILKKIRAGTPINPAPSKQISTPKRPAAAINPKRIVPGKQGIEPETKPSHPRLEDTRYALQAIAWSNDPAERLVVINGLVLREGDSIEGMIVAEIGQSEIVVQKESKMWQLVFRAR